MSGKISLIVVSLILLVAVGIGVRFLVFTSTPATLGVRDSVYDLNSDGQLNQADMQEWVTHYREYQETGVAGVADFNQDGQVNAADSRLLVLQLQGGQ